MFRLPKFYAEPARSSYTMPPDTQPTPSPPVITITLSSNKSADRRTLDITSGEEIIIGRASRSELKNLQASPDNALFDCPVVSRVHADLKASADGRHIRITDRTSLHGTTVNGRRLSSGVPFDLVSGDVIKLGDRVTRGVDTHDGVSLTFYLNNKLPLSSGRQGSPARGFFSVPSPSDAEGSDLESDGESIHSNQLGSSSAKTTPEQPKNAKVSMGSQEDPIDLDSVPARSSSIIDLRDEAEQRAVIPESVPIPYVSSPQDPRADDEDERLGYATNIPEAESEDDDAIDSNSDAEDDDTESVFDDNADLDDTNFTGNRPLSPELGDDDSAVFQAPRKEILEDFRGLTAQSYANPVFTRYDPVRNSRSSGEEQFTEAQRLATLPTSTYTYSSFGYGLPPASATDFQTSSRWDIPPPRPVPSSKIGDAVACELQPLSTFPRISYGTDPSFGEPFNNPYGQFHQAAPPSPPPVAYAQVAEPLQVATTQSHEISQPSTSPATKAKIAYIVEESSNEAPELLEASSTGVKRKAEEDLEERVCTDGPPEAKKQRSSSIAVATTSRNRHQQRAKGRGAVRRLATHAASAALGGLGVIAFLNSDMSQSLIEWLA